MRSLMYFILLIPLIACNKEELFDGPDTYFDDFEAYSEKEDLQDGDNELWSFFQLTRDENQITIDTTIVHSGNKAVRFECQPGEEGDASKCSINKQFMAFWEGETVHVDFWLYQEGNESAQWLFLFDLEEKVPVGAGPGIRIAIVDDQITVEHKFPNPNIHQADETAIPFPRDQWVHLSFETKLSRKKKGYIKVWQDDVMIIEQNDWQTLPKDILYFQQGTKGGYSQIEFGITANSQDARHVMYVDDVNVELVE
ncbi:MAG: heparin lyase I family protein [Crocinitomicaceae bacterium]